MSDLALSLSRTLLLMRDEIAPDTPDEVLLAALTTTRVAIVADAKTLACSAAQTAFVTAALLMARSGHGVWLCAPNVPITGCQPPLAPGRLIDELLAVGQDLLPGICFYVEDPTEEVDLAIALGDCPINFSARRAVSIEAQAWSGRLAPYGGARAWNSPLWPFGALAAAGLAANEAFKISMRRLLPFALSAENTALRFADSDDVELELAPSSTPFHADLGELDIVSGGAITNAALYCLARLPGVSAHGRIIEPEAADLSNLNRYMLLLRSARDEEKAKDLCRLIETAGLRFTPIRERYDLSTVDKFAPLAPHVLVGVDHIPSRWLVQKSWPETLVVGATTHWSAMASVHTGESGCAQCLHFEDDPDDGLIPTQACVSFWAGLLSATLLVCQAAGAVAPRRQQIYLTPFRPEAIYRAPAPRRHGCPTCGSTEHPGRPPR